MIIKEFILEFEKQFPTNLAYNWDNVGLQVGNENEKIRNVLVSLDLTTDVVNEAIGNNANLIVVHHPVIFSGIKSITDNTYLGRLLKLIIQNNINIYVTHTNFDISNHGMNKILANKLNLQHQEIIEYTTEEEGLGRYGWLKEPMILKNYIKVVKDTFGLTTLKLIGDENKIIKSVAICGGSGSSLINNPILNSVDLYISGDITYHHALDAINMGLTILDVGHNIEKNALSDLSKIIKKIIDSEVIVSTTDTNPYKIK